MTEAEILSLPAGRELDALVAYKVMGAKITSGSINFQGDPVLLFDVDPDIAEYSTDITAAWAVVENLGFIFSIDGPNGSKTGIDGDGWWANFWCAGPRRALGDTAPLAICRAALLTIPVFNSPSPPAG